MYTGSFYAFVLCGIFILPDGPQSFFWLLTLWALLKSLPDRSLSQESRLALLFAGLTTGLALLSKYHAAALVSGAFFFILFHNRKWLAAKETWIALLLAAFVFMPVILWNYKNQFISFTFHESRIIPEGKWFSPDFFVTEFLGEVFYNNPVNFVIVAASLVSLVFGRRFMDGRYLSLLLWISVPMVSMVFLFSLFRQTLPHWSGPAWFGFILIGASWLADRGERRGRPKLIPGAAQASMLFMLIVLGVAATQIRYGWIPVSNWKVRDLTLDLYGWKQLGEKVAPVIVSDEQAQKMPARAPILTFRWFPAANYDFYLARTTGNPVYATGSLTNTHKYFWIDHFRGDLPAGSDAWYIALSDDFRPADQLYGPMFDTILPPDTIRITRGGETVREVYLYRMKGLKKTLSFPVTLK
jgi:hypothetical protein